MALITTAEERLSQGSSASLVILGPAKIGKTSLVKTLDVPSTLVVDMEAGMLALGDCDVDYINVRQRAVEAGIHPWEFLRDFACLIAGPNPAVTQDEQPYSHVHYEYVVKEFGARQNVLGKYKTIFFDSITDTSRLCFSWSKTQPEAFSDKKLDAAGKPAYDGRGAYGKLGQEMVGAGGIFNQLKHTPDKNLIFVGLLDKITDDYGRSDWVAQVEGSKTGRELAGIFDQIISMVDLATSEGQHYRAFVCQQLNEWGYPAGDRSGKLDMIEEPHLGKLLDKIAGNQNRGPLSYALPQIEQVAMQDDGLAYRQMVVGQTSDTAAMLKDKGHPEAAGHMQAAVQHLQGADK